MAKPKKRLSKRDTLAERVYFIEGTHPAQRVTVRMGRPKKRRNDGRYECPVEISGWGRTTLRPVNGCDIFEALQLALILIGTELKHITEQTKSVAPMARFGKK